MFPSLQDVFALTDRVRFVVDAARETLGDAKDGRVLDAASGAGNIGQMVGVLAVQAVQVKRAFTSTFD